MTALTSDRHNSSSMAVFHSLVSRFREDQDEVSFILNSVDLDDCLGPIRAAEHCLSLRDVMTIMRRMAVTLGAITRNHRSLISSNETISMTAMLQDFSSRRNVWLRNLDKKPEDPVSGSDGPEALKAAFDVSNDISDGLANEPEEFTDPAMYVAISGFGKVKTPAMGRASDDGTKEVRAANAVTRAAANPAKRASNLIDFNKKSTAAGFGYQNSEVIGKEFDARFAETKALESPQKVSSLGGKLSNALKLRHNLVKVVDPPWYKPEVSKVTAVFHSLVSKVTASTNISEMLRQKTKASAPTPKPKNEKTDKAISSIRFQRLLVLNMAEVMPSLGSSFSTTEMAHMLMRMSLLLMFTVSTPEPANNL